MPVHLTRVTISDLGRIPGFADGVDVESAVRVTVDAASADIAREREKQLTLRPFFGIRSHAKC